MNKKQLREQFIVKNDPDINTFKKTLFIIGYIALLLIAFAIIHTFFIAFAQATSTPYSATANLNYSFEQNSLFNQTTPISYDQQFNLRNSTYYDGNYYGNYSFESEGLSGWTFHTPAYYSIIDFNNHKSVLKCNLYNAGTYDYFYRIVQKMSIGSIEYWFAENETITAHKSSKYLQQDTVNKLIWSYSDYIYAYNGTTSSWVHDTTVPLVANQWYHLRIDFNCTSDIFNVYLDGSLILANLGFYAPADYFNRFYWALYQNKLQYIDAIGVDKGNKYNATYGFDNEIGLTGNNISLIDSETFTSSGQTCEVVRYLDDHFGILNLSTTIDWKGFSDLYTAQTTNQFIELWVKHESGNSLTIQIDGNGGNFIYTTINSANVIFYKGNGAGGYTTQSFPTNTNLWTHIKYYINITNSCYDGYVNGILKANDFTYVYDRTPTSYYYFKVNLGTGGSYSTWGMDAIAYSWDKNYNVGDNLIPYWYDSGDNFNPIANYNANIKEVDKDEFSIYLTSQLYPIGFDTADGWQNWEYTGYDQININYDSQDILNDRVFTIDTAGIFPPTMHPIGINKTWDISGYLINVSTSFNFTDFTNTNAWYDINITSKDGTLINCLRCLYDGSDILLKYYDGSTFQQLRNDLALDTYYTFNLQLNYDSNLIVLEYNVNNDDIAKYMYPMLTTGKQGIELISLTYNDALSYDDFICNIDNVGVYVNGTSQSTAYAWCTIETNTNWNYQEYSNFYLEWSTTFGALYATNNSFVISNTIEPIYYLDTYSGINIINLYNRPLLFFSDYIPNATLLFFTQNDLNVSYFYIDGIKMQQGTNTYYFGFAHATDTLQNESYFYVLNNRLYYTFTSNTSNSEYMKLYTTLGDIESTNRSIAISGITTYAGLYSRMSIGYSDNTYTNLSFSTTYQSFYQYLPDNKQIATIIFTIFDNDNNINATITGYFTGFSFIYTPTYTPTLPAIIDNAFAVIELMIIIFPIPLILFIRFKKRYPDKELIAYLIAGITGNLISTIAYFTMGIIPLFLYITLFVSFDLIIIPSLLNRLFTLGWIGCGLMVYLGLFSSWLWVIMLLAVSFTTIYSIRKMRLD